MNRYAEFDMLRAVALGMILACHFIRSIGFHQLDIPLGCVGNMMFFVMSGWLLGLAWESNNYPRYGQQFLKRRLLRLLVPLWLFAIPYMIWFYASGHSLAVKDVFLNLFLLNWFARIPGMTPYWFITAITVFYIVLIALSCVTIQKSHPPCRGSHPLLFGLMVQGVLSLQGIRYGYILVMIVCGAFAFLNASSILSFFRKAAGSRVLVWIEALVCCLLFIIFWIFVLSGVIVVGTPICYYATIPITLLISSVVIALPATIHKTVIAKFLSSISYEVYLVHAAMLIWMKPVSCNVGIYVALFLLGTFVLAIILHSLSSTVIKYVTGRNV